jgi:Fur family peroxide stress response transcriptional regulator
MSSKLINIKGELEKCGIKPTFQRLCVLELMEQSSEHLTADAIYESLLKKMPTMSRTTIYNTLNLFLEKGLIAPIMITGTEVRYEISTNQHHHFLCLQCNRIYDVDVQCPLFESKEVDGHKIQEIHGYFKGICRNCLKQIEREPK